eukprot:758018-Hanusia_phi.AAC.5
MAGGRIRPEVTSMKSAKKGSQTQSKLSHFFKVANSPGAEKEDAVLEKKSLFSHATADKNGVQEVPSKQECEDSEKPKSDRGQKVAQDAQFSQGRGKKRERELAGEEESGRNLRRRVRKCLKESSSEEEGGGEEEQATVPHMIESDSESDQGKRSSSHTTPAKCELNMDEVECTPVATVGKRDRDGIIEKKAPFTPFQRKLESAGKKEKTQLQDTNSLSDKEAKRRHEQFVKKVSLFKEKLDREERKEQDEKQSSFQSVDLVPTDLT